MTMTSTTTLAPGVRVPVDNIEAVARVACRLDAIGERNTRSRAVFGLSWFHIRLLLVVGGARVLDGIASLLVIFPDWNDITTAAAGSDRESILWGVHYAAAIAGALVFGVLADKCGRRPILLVSLALFVLGLALHGVLESVAAITLFRAVSGLGFGGLVPVASTLVLELAPVKTRGRMVVLLEAFWAIGYMIALVLTNHLYMNITWHLPFYASLLVVATGGIYFVVPESPKWLASVGRYDEAVAILEQIERSYELAPFEDKAALDDVEAYHVAAPRLSESHIKRAALLFQTPFVRRTVVLSVLYAGVYLAYCIFFLYLYTAAKETSSDYSSDSATTNVLTASAAIPGCVFVSLVVQSCGLRWTLVGCLVAASISSVVLGFRVGLAAAQVNVSSVCLSFFLFSAIGCLSAYAPENYPTAIRGTGAAFPSIFKSVAMITAPSLWNVLGDKKRAYIAGFSARYNMEIHAVVPITCAIIAVVCLVGLVFGLETKRKDIEVYDTTAALSSTNGDHNGAFHRIGTPSTV